MHRIPPKSRKRSLAQFVAAILLVFAPPAPAAEPVPNLIQQLSGSDQNKRREAALQLEAAGPAAKEAVPALIKALDDNDKQVWSNSIAALANLGPLAEPAIPELIKTMDSRTPRGGRERDRQQAVLRAAFALSRIGKAAIPALIESLSAPDTSLRAGAAAALAGIGPDARDAIPALISNFGHNDPAVRGAVVDAIAAIGTDALQPTRDALAATEPLARATATRAIARLGAKARDTAPALIDLLKTERDPVTRAAIFSALPAIEADAKNCIPPLLDALNDPDESVRNAAVGSLLLFHSEQKEIVSALSTLLQNPNPAIAGRAADLLGRIGSPSASAIPALLAAMANRQPPPPPFIDALVQIGPASVPEILRAISTEMPDAITREHWSVKTLQSMGGMAALPLGTALSDQNATIRLTAARALGEMGAPARPAIPELVKACADAAPGVRAAALGGLVAARTNSKIILPLMQTAMRDAEPIVRLTALQLIPFLGEAAHPLGDAMLAALRDPDATVRRTAIENVGPAQPEAIPILLENLGDATMQPALLDALGRIGTGAESAAPRLIELLGSASKERRVQIFATLSKTGAPAVAPALEQALHDPDPEIRASALGAFARTEHDKKKRLDTLTAALADADPQPHHAAAAALGALGNSARDAAPQLIALLHNDADRAAALDALKKIEVRSVPHLMEALAIDNPEVRIFACERLAAVGPEAREAIPALKALQENQSEDVSRAARRALKKL